MCNYRNSCCGGRVGILNVFTRTNRGGVYYAAQYAVYGCGGSASYSYGLQSYYTRNGGGRCPCSATGYFIL